MAGASAAQGPLDPEGLWESRRGEMCCGMVGSYAVPVSTGRSKLSVEVPGVSAGWEETAEGMEYQPRTPRGD